MRDQERLEQADGLADIGLMSLGIAHDLNNAVAVVSALTEIALKDSLLTPRTREDLEEILRAAVRGRCVLDNFSSLAKKATLPMAPCDIHEVLRSLLPALGTLDLDRGDATPMVLANLAQLRRLFSNLIATATGEIPGPLALKTELVARPGGGMPLLRVIIEDFGSWISPEALIRMLKPLTVEGALQDAACPSLYLCSAIAMRHGGRLSFENKPAGGMKSTLYLPVNSLRPNS